MSTEEYNENEEMESQENSYESDYEEEEKPSRKGSRIVLIIFVIALVGLNAFLGYNIFTQKKEITAKAEQITKLENKKKSLLASIDSIKTVLASAENTISSQDDELNQLREKIEALEKDLRSKNSALKDLDRYKKEAQEVETLRAEVIAKTNEIAKLQNELAQEKQKNQEAAKQAAELSTKLNDLTQQKSVADSKVNLAKGLTGKVGLITTFKEKKGKYSESDKASQVNTVEVKYEVNGNKVADKGSKTAFIVVKKGSTVITQAGMQFDLADGTLLDYTSKDEFSYDGNSVSRAVKITLPAGLSAGKYTVDVYLDKAVFSSSSFSLR